MNRTNSQPEIIEMIMQEHDTLRDKVHRIHSTLAKPEPAPDEIENLMREFLQALVAHFSNEENDGFFTEVTTSEPRLTERADKLCVEHKELLHAADELCRFAGAGSPSMSWWRELHVRCHEFNKRLMRHEHEENRLLQEAHQSDIGAYD
jgi:iron-sulfur cluster repair protein YtfE (RIC family)